MTNTPWPAVWARVVTAVPSRRVINLRTAIGRVLFESRPHIINVASDGIRKEICQDERHPLYLPTVTKLMDHDRERLHWRIRVSSKPFGKSTIRSHAIRKVRVAMITELNRCGYDQYGKVIDAHDARGGETSRADLTGAFSLSLDQSVLTLSSESTEAACGTIVAWILKWQADRLKPPERSNDNRYTAPFDLNAYRMARRYLEDLQK